MSAGIGNDLLSPLGETLLDSASEHYTALVVPHSAIAPPALTAARADQLIRRPLQDQSAGEAMLAGLWLWHDCLEQSHNISQKLNNPTGSFWHAIMHRREGDFSNSKYWYARCKEHSVLRAIASAAENPDGLNASSFVDLVEGVHAERQSSQHEVAVQLQRLEWRELFSHCARAAAGVV